MTDDERRHFNNLILLCDECHSMADNRDNEDRFTVELLKQWKAEHEGVAMYSYLTRQPSLLGMVITAIADADIENATEPVPQNLNPYSIADKIAYNDVQRNRVLIDEYKLFHRKLNALYQALELEASFKKEKLLRNIHRIYLAVKGRYVGGESDELPLVRANADSIIEDVQDELLEMAKRNVQCASEDTAFGVAVIMVDAFVRCKILERPRTS